MADITNLRFAQFLKRTLGLKGIDPGRVVQTIVVPGMEMQDTYRPEMRSARGERSFCYYANHVNATASYVSENFGLGSSIANKIAIIKRVTWSLVMPTATVNPGSLWLGVTNAFASPPVFTSKATYKDSRYGTGGVIATVAGTGVNVPTVSIPANAYQYWLQIFPTSVATDRFVHQVDQLDIVITPGTFVGIDLRGDTAIQVGQQYIWACTIEGYEYTADPAELLTPT
jgi:hypothetical protein